MVNKYGIGKLLTNMGHWKIVNTQNCVTLKTLPFKHMGAQELTHSSPNSEFLSIDLHIPNIPLKHA